MDTPSPSGSIPGAEAPAGVDAAARKDSLIEFPSLFPIKVMGMNVDALVPDLVAIAVRFDSSFDASALELRPSSGGKYLGVTLTVTATSQAQLDDLYRAFTSHELVKVVL